MDTDDDREPGYYWVQLGKHPPEVACLRDGVWWLCGDGTSWKPDAVKVMSERLVLRPRLKVV